MTRHYCDRCFELTDGQWRWFNPTKLQFKWNPLILAGDGTCTLFRHLCEKCFTTMSEIFYSATLSHEIACAAIFARREIPAHLIVPEPQKRPQPRTRKRAIQLAE